MKDMPAMNWAMMFERNWFMIRGLKEAANLAKLESFASRREGYPVVMGIFGAGHIYGIIEQWCDSLFSASSSSSFPSSARLTSHFTS